MTLQTKLFIAGRWCDSANGATLPINNPATEETIARVALASRPDIDRAIDAAAKILPDWSKRTPYERGKILRQTADLLRARADQIARTMTMEQGKPLAEARGEVLHSADTFDWFAEEGKRAYGQVIPPTVANKRYLTIKHPIGVVATISPWNFPLTLQARKIAPALAAGCTVVAKPSEETPLTLIHLFECLQEAGVPDGVANCIVSPGQQFADAVFEHRAVRKVSFTGSTAVGKQLIKRSADQVKRLSLELGGHAPLIVLPDADPAAVAKLAVTGKFRNNGQVCIAPSRFYIHGDLKRQFTEAAVKAVQTLKLGNGLDAGVEIGPMISPPGLEKAERLVADAKSRGAEVLAGGGRSKRFNHGYFFEPTILDQLSPETELLTEEPFAPVMPLQEYRDLDEVIAAANNTNYGLAAYVFTQNLNAMWKLAEGLEAGIIGINDPVPATPQCPFGGMKESGLGRELGHEGLEAYLETKFVSMRIDGCFFHKCNLVPR